MNACHIIKTYLVYLIGTQLQGGIFFDLGVVKGLAFRECPNAVTAFYQSGLAADLGDQLVDTSLEGAAYGGFNTRQ